MIILEADIPVSPAVEYYSAKVPLFDEVSECFYMERHSVSVEQAAWGWAVEAMSGVMRQVLEIAEKAMEILERRIERAPLIGVRCCLMMPLSPLFNPDRMRCVLLVKPLRPIKDHECLLDPCHIETILRYVYYVRNNEERGGLVILCSQ